MAWGINCPKWHAGDSSVACAQAEDLARLARSLDKTRVCVFTEQVDADTPVFPQSAGAFNADIDLLDEFSAERALRTLELMSEANPDLPISVSFSTELSPEKSANVLLENAFKAADERGFIWGVFAGPLFDFAKRTREIGTEFEITEDIPAEDEPTEETSEETKAEETAEIAAPQKKPLRRQKQRKLRKPNPRKLPTMPSQKKAKRLRKQRQSLLRKAQRKLPQAKRLRKKKRRLRKGLRPPPQSTAMRRILRFQAAAL